VIIRDIIQDELEQAFNGRRTPEAALNEAARRGNIVLRQFEKSAK
jgi:sn-glycerol 3-phosphate transport system substrate-binding protein